MEALRTHGRDASLVEMASVAGVSKPVLYDEFGDKQGVADAIAVTLAQRLEAQVVSELSTGKPITVGDAIRAFINGLVNLIEDEPEIYHFIARSFRADNRAFLDNALVSVVHRRGAELIQSFAVGTLEGPQLELVTDSVFGMVFGAVESWQARRTDIPKDELVELLAAVINAGLIEVTRLAQSHKK